MCPYLDDVGVVRESLTIQVQSQCSWLLVVGEIGRNTMNGREDEELVAVSLSKQQVYCLLTLQIFI